MIASPAGVLDILNGDVFTSIDFGNDYDPEGFYNAVLPINGVPGYAVPTGKGGVFRITLSGEVRVLASASGRVRVILSPTVTGDIDADYRSFNDADLRYSMLLQSVVTLAPADEVYFWAKNNTDNTCSIQDSASVVLERLAV